MYELIKGGTTIVFYALVFFQGYQLAFGKVDESKLNLKPGRTVEEFKRKRKTGGYILMAIPVISFILVRMVSA